MGDDRKAFGIGTLIGAVGALVLTLLVPFLRSVFLIFWESATAILPWATQVILFTVNIAVIFLWIGGSAILIVLVSKFLLGQIDDMQDKLRNVADLLRDIKAPKPPTSMPLILAAVVQVLVLVLSNAVSSVSMKVVLSVFVWSFATILALTASRSTRNKVLGCVVLSLLMICMAAGTIAHHGSVDGVIAAACETWSTLQGKPSADAFAPFMIGLFVSLMLLSWYVYGRKGT